MAMILNEFTPEVAKGVLSIWEQYLGFGRDGKIYRDIPSVLSAELLDESNWQRWDFWETRMGSRWGEDSKLTMLLFDGELTIASQVQYGGNFLDKDQKELALFAEESFNNDVADYLTSLTRSSLKC